MLPVVCDLLSKCPKPQLFSAIIKTLLRILQYRLNNLQFIKMAKKEGETLYQHLKIK